MLKLIQEWRENGETIVFTNGVFDLLHRGHLTVFEQAAEFGNRLIVGVNSDISVHSLEKGPDRPLENETFRAEMIAGFEAVDAVVMFNEKTPHNLLSQIKPDVLVKGADYKPDDIVGAEFAERVERVKLLKGRSTTDLVLRIRSQNPHWKRIPDGAND